MYDRMDAGARKEHHVILVVYSGKVVRQPIFSISLGKQEKQQKFSLKQASQKAPCSELVCLYESNKYLFYHPKSEKQHYLQSRKVLKHIIKESKRLFPYDKFIFTRIMIPRFLLIPQLNSIKKKNHNFLPHH